MRPSPRVRHRGILGSKTVLRGVIVTEREEVRTTFVDKRKTEIGASAGDINEETICQRSSRSRGAGGIVRLGYGARTQRRRRHDPDPDILLRPPTRR